MMFQIKNLATAINSELPTSSTNPSTSCRKLFANVNQIIKKTLSLILCNRTKHTKKVRYDLKSSSSLKMEKKIKLLQQEIRRKDKT